MEVIKEILKDLEFEPENLDEGTIEETYIYRFIVEKLNITTNYYDYLKIIAVKAISCELYRQDQHGNLSFEENTIFDLLVDRDDEEYKAIFEYIFEKTTHLEHHKINKIDLFFGENLKIEYHLMLTIFAKIITADLNIALEKVKNKLISNVTIIEWSDLIVGGNGVYLDAEIERMEGIINDVLG